MKVTIETMIDSSLDTVWKSFITPEDIIRWNFASSDWICPEAGNDFRIGGKFNYRMETKDGSMGFNLEGKFTAIKEMESIDCEFIDGRTLNISFKKRFDSVKVNQTFEAEDENSVELQKQGWQSILNNFKEYVESK